MDKLIYRTVKNFGGEKILANLVKYQNSPSFFRQFILHVQLRIVIWCTFYRHFNSPLV